MFEVVLSNLFDEGPSDLSKFLSAISIPNLDEIWIGTDGAGQPLATRIFLAGKGIKLKARWCLFKCPAGGCIANPSRTAGIVTTRSNSEKIRIYIPIAC